MRGGTAMVVACVMGNAEILRTLLAMRAKADAVTVAIDDSEELFECRPLVTACRYNHPKCVSLLLAESLSTQTLAIATKELEEFPSFTECAKLVRRAVERREQREQRFGVRPPAAPAASVDAVSATERADAATDELWRALLGPDADALETITRGPLPAAGPDTYVDIRRI